jgi:hypothetical protein
MSMIDYTLAFPSGAVGVFLVMEEVDFPELLALFSESMALAAFVPPSIEPPTELGMAI